MKEDNWIALRIPHTQGVFLADYFDLWRTIFPIQRKPKDFCGFAGESPSRIVRHKSRNYGGLLFANPRKHGEF